MSRAEDLLQQFVGEANTEKGPDWIKLSPEEMMKISLKQTKDNALAAIQFLSAAAKPYERSEWRTYGKMLRGIDLLKKKHRDDLGL
jgi:hypothetical protein